MTRDELKTHLILLGFKRSGDFLWMNIEKSIDLYLYGTPPYSLYSNYNYESYPEHCEEALNNIIQILMGSSDG